ncbi:hypothetical protein BKA70DRAFT_1235245 [Coprinopsis sp. MPI-PUGE-AT-0042]|nr:hypothetical protein BKA70DRAFT_1235245 [Coprinopsis sp. MPI-PUGE-AT-0042]
MSSKPKGTRSSPRKQGASTHAVEPSAPVASAVDASVLDTDLAAAVASLGVATPAKKVKKPPAKTPVKKDLAESTVSRLLTSAITPTTPAPKKGKNINKVINSPMRVDGETTSAPAALELPASVPSAIPAPAAVALKKAKKSQRRSLQRKKPCETLSFCAFHWLTFDGEGIGEVKQTIPATPSKKRRAPASPPQGSKVSPSLESPTKKKRAAKAVAEPVTPLRSDAASTARAFVTSKVAEAAIAAVQVKKGKAGTKNKPVTAKVEQVQPVPVQPQPEIDDSLLYDDDNEAVESAEGSGEDDDEDQDNEEDYDDDDGAVNDGTFSSDGVEVEEDEDNDEDGDFIVDDSHAASDDEDFEASDENQESADDVPEAVNEQEEDVESDGGDDGETMKALPSQTGKAAAAKPMVYATDHSLFVVKKLPKVCEVYDPDLHDPVLASRNFYANRPKLLKGVWKPDNASKPLGFPIPSVIPSFLKKMNVEGKSSRKVVTVAVALNKYRVATFAMAGLVGRCHLWVPSPRPPRAKFHAKDVDLTMCANEFEYTESAICMALNTNEVELPMYQGAVTFSTSTTLIDEGVEDDSDGANLASVEGLLNKKNSGPAASEARPLRFVDTVPIYDGRYTAIDYNADIDKIASILPEWDGEIPKNSAAIVGSIFQTPKSANMCPKLHPLIQWVVVIGTRHQLAGLPQHGSGTPCQKTGTAGAGLAQKGKAECFQLAGTRSRLDYGDDPLYNMQKTAPQKSNPLKR